LLGYESKHIFCDLWGHLVGLDGIVTDIYFLLFPSILTLTQPLYLEKGQTLNFFLACTMDPQCLGPSTIVPCTSVWGLGLARPFENSVFICHIVTMGKWQPTN
jgi:hypothetical protein